MSSAIGYTCDKHPDRQALTGSCPDCVEAFTTRRDASTMTAEERASEFEWWGHILTIPLGDLHQRIEELVGRGVWTHELAYPELLAQEIRSGQAASLGDVLDKIPADTRVIVVEAE